MKRERHEYYTTVGKPKPWRGDMGTPDAVENIPDLKKILLIRNPASKLPSRVSLTGEKSPTFGKNLLV
jgi:hypothetical protein